MKRNLLCLIILILAEYKASAQTSSQRIETIDSLDTVVFDLSQAVINGNYVAFPVSILSDDTIYALDFSLKYDESHITYDSIIDLTNYLQSFSFYNNNDSTLRFTSNSLQAVGKDTPLVSVRFNLLATQIVNSDFNTIKAYLNGTMCSIKLLNAGTTVLDEIDDSALFYLFPNPSKGTFKILSAVNAKFQLMDIYGKEIFSTTNLVNNQTCEINIENCSGGTYFIKVWNKQLETTKKILILK